MRTAFVVFVKEARDNLRDRRTVMSALLFGPVFGPLLFVFLMQAMIHQQLQGEGDLPVTVVGAEHAPNLMQHLIAQGVTPEHADAATNPRELIDANNEHVVLVIPGGVDEQLRSARPATLQVFYDRSESKADRHSDRLKAILQGYSAQLGALRLQARGISPQVMQPYVIDSVDVSTPTSRSALVFGMLPYFVLLATIMGAFYLAIDTTAGERERGSLESLLSLPLSRVQLVLGKVAAAVAFSMLSLILTVVVFALAFPLLDLGGLGISTSLDASQVLAILAVSLPFTVFAAGMLTLVASYAKSFKEAQTYLSIVMLVPLIPVIVGTVMSADLSLTGALIPGFSQHLLIMEIIKGSTVPGMFMLCSAGTTVLAGALMIAGAVALYRSERILG
ncbi:MAG TPA: ABC transporter permease [Gammaproteobacteria bacterium]